MLESMPPPNTHTPAAFASRITERAASPTAAMSSLGTFIADAGKDMRYFVIASPSRKAR